MLGADFSWLMRGKAPPETQSPIFDEGDRPCRTTLRHKSGNRGSRERPGPPRGWFNGTPNHNAKAFATYCCSPPC